MQITYQQLTDFLNVTNRLLAESKETSKFNYALDRVAEAGNALMKKYQRQVDGINIKHCLEKDGIIARDAQGGLQYSKEGMAARNVDLNKLTDTSVDIEPFYVAEVPEMPFAFRAALEGFVIRPADDASVVTKLKKV